MSPLLGTRVAPLVDLGRSSSGGLLTGDAQLRVQLAVLKLAVIAFIEGAKELIDLLTTRLEAQATDGAAELLLVHPARFVGVPLAEQVDRPPHVGGKGLTKLCEEGGGVGHAQTVERVGSCALARLLADGNALLDLRLEVHRARLQRRVKLNRRSLPKRHVQLPIVQSTGAISIEQLKEALGGAEVLHTHDPEPRERLQPFIQADLAAAVGVPFCGRQRARFEQETPEHRHGTGM